MGEKNDEKGERKPVAAVVTTTSGGNAHLIVVCDDGSAWLSQPSTECEWAEMQPVPGTRADREKKERRRNLTPG